MIKALTRDIAISKNAERALLVLLFSFLTFAAAMIKIYTPFSIVPLTLQTFVLYMAVYYLNAKENGISQSIYIIAGMVGAPVFAAGIIGALALVGPTAGYLIGFIVSGIVMSYIASKVKINFLSAAMIFSLGAFILLGLGTAHLWLVYRIPFAQAFASGFAVFIPVEILKIAVAAGLCGLKK